MEKLRILAAIFVSIVVAAPVLVNAANYGKTTKNSNDATIVTGINDTVFQDQNIFNTYTYSQRNEFKTSIDRRLMTYDDHAESLPNETRRDFTDLISHIRLSLETINDVNSNEWVDYRTEIFNDIHELDAIFASGQDSILR